MIQIIQKNSNIISVTVPSPKQVVVTPSKGKISLNVAEVTSVFQLEAKKQKDIAAQIYEQPKKLVDIIEKPFVRIDIISVPTTGGGEAINAISALEISQNVVAGETIEKDDFCFIGPDGRAYLGQSNDIAAAEVQGIAKNGGLEGDTITLLAFGKVVSTGFNYISRPLYLTMNGKVSLTPPVTGFVKEVGKGFGPNAIFVNIQKILGLAT